MVGGVGSGASTGGVIEYLRQKDPTVQLVGLQPFGSVTFGSESFSDPEAIIAGIGSSIPFDNVHHELYDAVHWRGAEGHIRRSRGRSTHDRRVPEYPGRHYRSPVSSQKRIPLRGITRRARQKSGEACMVLVGRYRPCNARSEG